MRKVVLLEHMSLDGFVGGPNGELDWIRFGDNALWEYIGALSADADVAIYGRVTYQMMEAYWPTAGDQPNASKHDIEHARWVNNALKLVISNTLTETTWANTRIVSDNIAGQISELKQQPGKNLFMIGSPGAAQTLMELGLIDEYRINLNPVVLGKGIPLFKDTPVNLKLVESRTFRGGVLGLHYDLVQ